MATGKELAEHLCMTERNLHTLKSRGVAFESKGRGGYELDHCRRIYIEYLRRETKGQHRGNGNDTDYNSEQTRLTKERADNQELKNRQLRGELIELEKLNDLLPRLYSIIRSNIDSLPAHIKRNCPQLNQAGINAVKKELAYVMETLQHELANLELIGVEEGSEENEPDQTE